MAVRWPDAMSTLRNASIALIGVAALGGMLHSALKPRVLISNASREVLENVQLVGVGFRERVEPMKPGDSRCVVVAPVSDSGLVLVFTAAGRTVTRGDLAYIEPGYGYRVHLVVAADLTTTSNTQLKSLLPWCSG